MRQTDCYLATISLAAVADLTVLLSNCNQPRGARLRDARMVTFGAAAKFGQRAAVKCMGDLRRIFRRQGSMGGGQTCLRQLERCQREQAAGRRNAVLSTRTRLRGE